MRRLGVTADCAPRAAFIASPVRIVFRHLLLFLLLATAARAAERDIVRTFPALPGCSLRIDSYRGQIQVSEADTAEIRVAVHLEIGGGSEAEAEQLLRGLQLDFATEGPVVSVVVRHPAESGVRFFWNEEKQIAPTFRVTIPRTCNLELRTRAGNILVGSVVGRVQARTEAGDIFLRLVEGKADVSVGAGDIVVSRCLGPVTARVMQGTIRAGTLVGACDLRTSSGPIEVQSARGGGRIHATAGDVILGIPRTFGGVAEVTTSGGDIRLDIDPAANCDVEAVSSLFASVRSQLPLVIGSGRDGSRKLAGKLNAGGNRVRVRASGGGVRLQAGGEKAD